MVTDLCFSYRADEPAVVSDLTHAFLPGALTAIAGESGRGKSTLLFVLGLLLSPTSGRVILDGADVTHAPDGTRAALRASRIGFMFQDAQLDQSRSILDNVMEPSLYAGRRVVDVKSRATQLLDRFGVGHRTTHRPGQISGGQAQRVALCRALINDPLIILADEPTGNLDRGNAELVLQALQHAAEGGCSVVVATHDAFIQQHCDEVVAL